ncbi:MAG: 3-phosphoglycerate dehydrogenase [Phycisphaerae bacterium]|nr:3-phosphoglycerate dehydrogenase [Phycisphaerae bacterium]
MGTGTASAGSPRPRVVVSEELSAGALAWLGERCEVECVRFDAGAAFDAALSRADALVVRTYTKVTAELLAKGARLRVVGRAGVGLDSIDVCACRARGVEVVYTPDANTVAVSEYVLALVVDAFRPRGFVEGALAQAEWSALRKEMIAPRQLSELTLGILGLGRIGKRVARWARALDMNVIYHDLLEMPEAVRCGARPVSRDELLAGADVLTIHVDGRASNRGLVTAEWLARVKRDVTIVNTSRGFVVEAGALAAFLRTSAGARAILDVHEPEPFGAEYPLLGLPNAFLAAHLAACTRTAHENMSWVVRDVWRVLAGEAAEFSAP